MTDLLMYRAATFDDKRKHRMRLERQWGEGHTVVFCCKNPSDADENREDPTLRRMIGFAHRWGYRRLLVVNADTFVTSDPWDCAQMVESLRRLGMATVYMEKSVEAILDAAAEADLFIAAWGHPLREQEKWYRQLHGLLADDAGIELHHLGLTKDGWPIHPLARGKHRIPDDQQPIRWTT
jgi:hypothetical protein